MGIKVLVGYLGTGIGSYYLSKKERLSSSSPLLAIVTGSAIGTFCYWRNPQAVLQLCAKSAAVLLPTFVHIDAKHFIVNSLALALFWIPSCDNLGAAGSACVFGVSAITVNVANNLFGKSHGSITVGSSGAVAAIISSVLAVDSFGPIDAPFGAIGLVISSLIMLITNRHFSITNHLSHFVGASLGIVVSVAKPKQL